MKEDLTPPKNSKWDLAHGAAKAALSFVPTASDVFSLIVTSPLEKRRLNWESNVSDVLLDLSRRTEKSIEELSKNEELVDTVAKATLIALRNHSKEKHQALLAAVFNVGSNTAPDHSLYDIFLDFIDTFTEWHLRILVFLNDPNGFFERNSLNRMEYVKSGGVLGVLERVYPDLKDKKEFCDLIWKDIHRRGLSDQADIRNMTTNAGETHKRTNGIGDQFVEFITITK